MFKTMQNQDQQSPEKKRQMEQPRGSDQYAAMRQIASLMGNQAMLGMMQSQGQYHREQTPFFDDMRKKFGQKQKVESPASPARQSSGGTSLPDYLREKFEKKSGLPMDDVRVHYNSDKPAELVALAYTQRTDVHIGPGQEAHLEHELVHVVQQKQGIVQPTEVFKGVSLNSSPFLESKADSLEVQQAKKYSNLKSVIQCSGKAPLSSPSEMPQYLYHGTSDTHFERIKNRGLCPANQAGGLIPLPGSTSSEAAIAGRTIESNHDITNVHMTENVEEAKSYALRNSNFGYILKIDTSKIKDRLQHESTEWRYCGIIPINHMKWVEIGNSEESDFSFTSDVSCSESSEEEDSDVSEDGYTWHSFNPKL